MNTVALQKRIKNVQGQLDGIMRMLDNEKSCLDVLTQLKAARAGLDKTMALFVQEHLMHCVGMHDLPAAKRAEIERIILELAKS